MTRRSLWSVITACTCQLASLIHGFSPLLNNHKYINYQDTTCNYKHIGSNYWNNSQGGADLYEQMRSYGSSNATPHEGGKGGVAQHNLDKLHLHDPLSFLWRSLYFASLRHRAFITEQWFTYTGSCETPRVRGLTRLLRLPRSPTNSSDPISPAVGHNMPYAQLPIVHCPIPIARNYPPELAQSHEKWG